MKQLKDKKVLLIGNGEKPSVSNIKNIARKSDVIIAADGGANILAKTNIIPDLIIGDLDSITAQTLKKFEKKSKIIKVKRQDNTDLEKALDYIVKKGYKNCHIACISGNRFDFNFCNLLIPLKYSDKLNIVFEEKNWKVYIIKKDTVFECKKNSLVSVSAVGTPTITLKNLKYKLSDYKMKNCEIAVSNVAVKDTFEIKVKNGKLFVFVQNIS